VDSVGWSLILFLKIHWKLIVFLVLIISIFWIAYTFRNILFPFGIGLILAYFILPVIKLIERRIRFGKYQQARRVWLISSTYLIFFGLFAGLSLIGFATLRPAFSTLATNAPNYWDTIYHNLMTALDSFTDTFLNSLPETVHQQIDTYIYNLGLNTINTFTQSFSGGSTTISFSAIGVILGIATMPVFLFYVLKDWEKLEAGFYSAVPSGIQDHTRHIAGIIDRVMGQYLRAQLFLGLIVGTLTLIGLLIMQVPFAMIIAIVAGVGEMVPTFGPWVSAAVAVFVTLAVAPEKIGPVILLFLGVQLVENVFLVPRVQGGFLHIHPAIALVLLIFGSYIAGIWGVILILPLTATIIAVAKYIRYVAQKDRNMPPLPQFPQDFSI
jgi:predicted PurR-regulated permease PerM